MDEFCVECYISDDTENKSLSNLDKKDMETLKTDIEARALSEYYNKKIKVSGKKIDFKKRFC